MIHYDINYNAQASKKHRKLQELQPYKSSTTLMRMIMRTNYSNLETSYGFRETII